MSSTYSTLEPFINDTSNPKNLYEASALLAEEDCGALLGSETGKLVAAVGRSGLDKGIKAGSIIKAAARPWEAGAEASRIWPRAEGRMWQNWMRP